MEIKFDQATVILNMGTPLEKTILSEASFDIKEKGIYAFVGASNSGKTAIGELMDALIKPTRGSVKINNYINDGKRIKNINKLRFDVGYLLKNPNDMFFSKTVKQEIAFGMKYFKYKVNTINERTKDSLKIVGLDESYLDRKIDTLSLKEQKKVALACIFAFNPKIIVLDEPTIGLNKQDKDDLIRILKLMKNNYDRTIILLTKDTDFIYSFVDYVYLMSKTKIVSSGDRNILKDIELLTSIDVETPKMVKFINYVKNNKNINLEDYDNYKDIKDLIKGVYRNVF